MAETAYYRAEGGSIWVMDLPLPEVMAEKVTKGYLKRVDRDGNPWVDETGTEGMERPAKAASKAQWVGWAVRVHGFTPDDAEAMTKDDLAGLPDTPEVDG